MCVRCTLYIVYFMFHVTWWWCRHCRRLVYVQEWQQRCLTTIHWLNEWTTLQRYIGQTRCKQMRPLHMRHCTWCKMQKKDLFSSLSLSQLLFVFVCNRYVWRFHVSQTQSHQQNEWSLALCVWIITCTSHNIKIDKKKKKQKYFRLFLPFRHFVLVCSVVHPKYRFFPAFFFFFRLCTFEWHGGWDMFCRKVPWSNRPRCQPRENVQFIWYSTVWVRGIMCLCTEYDCCGVCFRSVGVCGGIAPHEPYHFQREIPEKIVNAQRWMNSAKTCSAHTRSRNVESKLIKCR